MNKSFEPTWRLLELPRVSDPRGNLSMVESMVHIPFDLKRVYYLYDVPGGADRGSHAHKKLQQLIIAISGSFDVHLDDGCNKEKFSLNRPFKGLYVPEMTWRYLDNFSSGAVCLVLASQNYDEDDYYRDYNEFNGAVRLLK